MRTNYANVQNIYILTLFMYILTGFIARRTGIHELIGYITILVGIIGVIFANKAIVYGRDRIIVFFTSTLFILWIVINSFCYGSFTISDLTQGRLIVACVLCMNLYFSMAIIQDIKFSFFDKMFYSLGLVSIIYTIKIYGISDLVQGFLGIKRLGDEIIGINIFGIYFAILAIFVFWKAYCNKKYRIANILLFVCFAALSLTSGSRKAMIGILLGCVGIIYLLSKQSKVINIAKILIVVLLVFYIFSTLNITSGIFERASTLWSDQNTLIANSDRVRKELIMLGLQGWLKHPLLGNGFNTFQFNNTYGLYSHNNYVELLYGTGLLGTLLYYIPKFLILKRLIQIVKIRRNELSVLFVILTIMLLIFDFACVSYYDVSMIFVWWMAGIFVMDDQREDIVEI